MAVSNIILQESTYNIGSQIVVPAQYGLGGGTGGTLNFTACQGAQGIAFTVYGSPVGLSFQLLAAIWNGSAWVAVPAAIAVQDRSLANPSGARLAAVTAIGNYWASIAGLQAIGFNVTAYTSGTASINSVLIPDQAQT